MRVCVGAKGERSSGVLNISNQFHLFLPLIYCTKYIDVGQKEHGPWQPTDLNFEPSD